MSQAEVTIIKKDATHAKVLCSSDLLFELADQFTFDVQGAKFSPQFKSGRWDGKKRLLSTTTKLIYNGLIPELISYCNDSGYTVDDQTQSPQPKIDYETIEKFCVALNLHSRGVKIDIRPYQVDAIYQSILNGRLTLVSPTSSGKSLIIYCIARWFLLTKQRILLMVPNLGLIAQMEKDFADYSSHNGWNSEKYVQTIHGGKSKTVDKYVTIANWQAIYNVGRGSKKGGQPADGLSNEWFEQFDLVFCDEVHLSKATSLTGIMERCTNAHRRFGLTGTLSGIDVDELVIKGLFGHVMQVITTSELMDNGDITKLKMKILHIPYPANVKDLCKKMTYQEELDYIVTNPTRNKFICNLALSQKQNVLVFFNFKDKQGKILVDMLEEMNNGSKQILYIDGDVDINDREDIRSLIATSNNLIVVASFGTSSTGLNIPNIHSAIFASPSKSKIGRNMIYREK